MGLRFSQRYGYTSVREVFQIQSIDSDLKIGIWNALQMTCFDGDFNKKNFYFSDDNEMYDLCERIWCHFLKRRLNLMPLSWLSMEKELEDFFFERAIWYEIYDLVEFIVNNYKFAIEVKEEVNQELEKGMSAYRLVDNYITAIIHEPEIQSIEEAISNDKLKHVSVHLESALNLMSDKTNPDFRNSIKESISAVEGVAKLITGEKKAELKPALNKLEKELNIPLHGALKSGFQKIYGYTSDGDGIRHSLTETENVSFEDAKFMLVACSAFVNYLLTKADIAEMELDKTHD